MNLRIMYKRYIGIVIIVFSLCFFTYILVAQESPDTVESMSVNKNDLLQFISEHELKLSWDSNYNIGLIRKENIIISFQPGLPFVLINFNVQRFLRPVELERGRFWASDEFLQLLRDVLIDKTVVVNIPYPSRQPGQDQSTIANEGEGGKILSSPIITKENNSTPSISNPLSISKSAKFNQIVTLVIDPGHGGKTPGAVGRFLYQGTRYKVMEKDVVLEVSKMIVSKMNDLYPNLNIIMTRNKDEYVSLEERTIIANKYLDELKEGEAMLFVSVHANAALTEQASGYEVWYLPPDYRRDDLISKDFNHSKIYSIINNLREEEITLESARLADLVIRGLDGQIGSLSRKRGVKEEKFYVVRNAKMPAVLIELGFLTNPREGHNLLQKDYKEKLANGVVSGLNEYLKLFEK